MGCHHSSSSLGPSPTSGGTKHPQDCQPQPPSHQQQQQQQQQQEQQEQQQQQQQQTAAGVSGERSLTAVEQQRVDALLQQQQNGGQQQQQQRSMRQGLKRLAVGREVNDAGLRREDSFLQALSRHPEIIGLEVQRVEKLFARIHTWLQSLPPIPDHNMDEVAANPYPLNFVSFPGGTPEVEDGGSDTLGSVNQSRMLSPTTPATGAAGGADTVPINRDMLREKRHAEDREDALRAFREERRRLRELEGGGEGIVDGEEDEEELLRLQQQQGRPGMSPIQVNPPSSIRESGSMSSGGKEGGHARQESYITDIHNDPSLYENPNMDKMAAFLHQRTCSTGRNSSRPSSAAQESDPPPISS